MKYLIAALFLLTIPAANWLISNFGVTCIPNGPCLIPVWPGVLAPSGVLMIGLAFTLRDAAHELLGARWVAALILAGCVLSAFIAPPAIALASAIAFLISEFADLFVYAPLRERRLILAVIASGIVGAIVDSIAFLWIAFGSLDHLLGQLIGKGWMVALAAGLIAAGLRVKRA